MDTKSLIANNLKAYMKAAGKTQAELAEHLGVTQSCVSNWARGVNSISVEYVPGICEFLGISIARFFDDEQNGAADIAYACISLDEDPRAEVRDFIEFKKRK